MRRIAALTLILSATAAFPAGIPNANPAWNGTWKSNPAKSDTSGHSYSLVKEGAGFRYSDGSAFNFVFACDGKAYPANFANLTSICQQTDPHSYKLLTSAGAKLVQAAETTVSADGMTVDEKGINYNADGTSTTLLEQYKRVGGSPVDGPVGTWKAVKADLPAYRLIYRITGNNMTITHPEDDRVTQARLDGTPGADKGAGIPPGARTSITLVAPDKIHIVTLQDGKPTMDIVKSLSADGRTITSVSYLVGKEDEKITIIFDKQ